jgi:hypothetical protein
MHMHFDLADSGDLEVPARQFNEEIISQDLLPHGE